MPRFTETRTLDFTARQIYDLVLDVEKYPEFLPYCSKCFITSNEEISKEKNITYADMEVNIGFYTKSYTSRIEHGILNTADGEGYYISISQVSGPFLILNTNWSFVKDGETGCNVKFDIEFEFESEIANILIGKLFNEATKMMIKAFENRARSIYGNFK